jgi:hypothetical protein
MPSINYERNNIYRIIRDIPRWPDGTIRVVDPEILEAEGRKPPPQSDAEAAERYRVMQAEQLIRWCNRNLPGHAPMSPRRK